MIKPRIVPEDIRISCEEAVRACDESMRRRRDRGKLQTCSILRSRIDLGCALEIEPGPGYEGLEWLKSTGGTTLKGLDASEEMVELARRNARNYNLAARAEYFVGDAGSLPFSNDRFDAVISTRSLHRWDRPEETFAEVQRVLRPGGKYFISDLRRDMNSLMKWFNQLGAPGGPARIRSSLNASYTLQEVKEMLQDCDLDGWKVAQTPFCVVIWGRKDYGSAEGIDVFRSILLQNACALNCSGQSGMLSRLPGSPGDLSRSCGTPPGCRRF
jgi:SAM-dependent methyltransferase